MKRPSARLAAAILACATTACAASPAVRPHDLATPDGRVRAAAPPGEGWQCLDRRQEDRGAAKVQSFVLCQIATRQGDLFVRLLDQELRADAPSADKLCAEDYPATYRMEYSNARVVNVRPAVHQGRTGCAVTLDGTDRAGDPARVADRIFVSGPHIVSLSAQGSAAAFAARRAEIDRWFASATFTSLR